MTSKREDREALIEEATAGLSAFDAYWGDGGPVEVAYGRPWELIRRLLVVFEQALGEATSTPTDDERETLAITDAEWREFQAIPEQGYSHRHWVDSRIAERVMRDRRRPVQGEPTSETPEPSAEDLRPGFFSNGQCRHYQLADGWAKIWCTRTDDDHTEHETAGGVRWTPDPPDTGWSTEDRRAAEAEAKRRFLEWDGSDDEGVRRFGAGSVSGFILGAEWWKVTHPARPEAQVEPTDAQVQADAKVYAAERYREVIYLSEYNAAVDAFVEGATWGAALRTTAVATEQGENR